VEEEGEESETDCLPELFQALDDVVVLELEDVSIMSMDKMAIVPIMAEEQEVGEGWEYQCHPNHLRCLYFQVSRL
jgi:hypothetical protein